MNPERKKLHPLIIAVIVLLVLALILCVSVLGLWLHGQKVMTQTTQKPALPQQDTSDSTQTPENSVIEYNGKRYQYNQDMVNILLLGIDSDVKPADAAGNYDQADVLVLAALNLKDQKMSLITLSRDILCDIELTDADGEVTDLIRTQLALSYAYGDGQHASCELTRNAVSNIFYGLPIQGYGAYYISGIADLNDAVGGVTVKLIYDWYFDVFPGAERLTGDLAGKDVTLHGKEAEAYVRMRSELRDDSNQLRMVRQKQYMLALISQAKTMLLENPASFFTLYDAVDDYILTNLSLSELSYLATKAVSMDFTGEIYNVAGEYIVNEDNIAEVHVDQQALYDLMLNIFYSEIP